MKTDKKIVNCAEACRYMGCGRTLFYAQIKNGFLPSPIKLGNRSLWDIDELNDAIERLKQHRQLPTRREETNERR